MHCTPRLVSANLLVGDGGEGEWSSGWLANCRINDGQKVNPEVGFRKREEEGRLGGGRVCLEDVQRKQGESVCDERESRERSTGR
jgi:hypothetical protein